MDPINTYCSVYTTSNEICRMSWYLIEKREQNGNANSLYSIVNRDELLDVDANVMHVNRNVRFMMNMKISKGEIVLASDNQTFVERHMKVLTQNAENTHTTSDKENSDARFLVQYATNGCDLVHAIIHQRDISWPLADLKQGDEVYIKVGEMGHIAKILYKHQREKVLHKYLLKLKTRCFDMLHTGRYHKNHKIIGNPWLLIQYSTSPINVQHVILRFSDTVWQKKNMYSCIVAYISDGTAIYQGNILSISSDRHKLQKKMRKTRRSCLSTGFFHEPELNFETLLSLTEHEQPHDWSFCEIDDFTSIILSSCMERERLEVDEVNNIGENLDGAKGGSDEIENILKYVNFF